MREIEGEAREELKQLHSGYRGKIRIGVISSGNCNAFLTLLSAFRRQYPAVLFNVFEGNTYELLDDLGKNRIDMAVVRTPFTGRNMQVKQLEKDYFTAASVENKKRTSQTNVTLEEISGEPLIIYRRWERILRDAFDKKNVEPHIICINDDARTCLQWAEAGLGTALIPSSLQPMAQNVSFRILQEESLISTICLVRNEKQIFNESAEALWNFCK